MVTLGILITLIGRGLDNVNDPALIQAKIRKIELLGRSNIIIGLLVIALAATLGTIH